MKPLIWICLAMTVTIGIESYFLWSKSKEVGAAVADAGDRARVNDSLKVVGQTHDSAYSILIAAVRVDSARTQHRLDSALRIINGEKDSLKSAKKALQRAVSDLGVYVASIQDTSLSRKYDSVTHELNIAYGLVGDYANSNDSTISMLAGEINYRDSAVRVLTLEIAGLKSALNACTVNFDGLKKDTDKLAKKTKLRGILTKISTVAAAILAAVVLIK